MTSSLPSGKFEEFRDSLQNPLSPPQITQQLSENVILTTVEDLYNWARLSSLWPLLYGTACCFIEFAALIGSRFDFDRYGLIPRASPRQADLIILAGTLNMKMAPATLRLYEQMADPKYVIAMGACMITGGMFSADSPTAVRGADKILPIDVYIPGCPPRPEAIMDAIIKLRKKISAEALQERGIVGQTHRYYTRPHQLKPISPIYTGDYLRAPDRQQPPQQITEAIGMPVPPALATEPANESDKVRDRERLPLNAERGIGTSDLGA
ncbi:NADH-quinone oxidoreductase subunit NuoB [Oscillatoria sp. FACHB-1407]|uniref:NADH-quinone oxidoreductase subunit NuoB n=1 Tax=Oscillatoria sp. FACHB-1407 TaxID=2692847 RepID=UPI001687C3A9|nr:NADH-quinone oxidoreductase subunit NuoB [Oscillatoria sp. FACHB-1407]MBD2461862.1 NADH-quinone oxidoreductase subunit NuoB [Oscillatoria sp. FACHB-1407]